MLLSIDPKAPCACGSGKLIEECNCFRSVDTHISTPPTGFAHPRCYFGALNDCSQDLSREHYNSRSILEHLDEQPGGLQVSGLSYAPEPRRLPPAALASRILCKRHNTALSPLDSRMLRFYVELSKLPEYLVGGRVQTRFFNGHDIERWMIKLLCGAVVSGNARFKDAKIAEWTPPRRWLDILLGRAAMPPTWGLYLTNKLGSSLTTKREIVFHPFVDPSGQVFGARMSLNGLVFILALSDVSNRDELLAESTYRPNAFIYGNPEEPHVVLGIFWEQPGDGKCIGLGWKPGTTP